jgi:phosphatidylserine/phosphatidylglycerophosphate/cardiolipin synthase-like enzyme
MPSETSMPLPDLSVLDRHKTGGFPPDYPPNVRSFFSPVDDVHGALLELVQSASSSLCIAMYGFDDDELADAIEAKLADPAIEVQLTFDSSQAGGVHEREILAREAYPASSVAIGRSEHGAIQHMKLLVIDGTYRVSGSTNWSRSGEALQDNEMTVIHDRVMAVEARTRIDAIHAHMLAAAAKKAA